MVYTAFKSTFKKISQEPANPNVQQRFFRRGMKIEKNPETAGFKNILRNPIPVERKDKEQSAINTTECLCKNSA
jgi:hypothetical protein